MQELLQDVFAFTGLASVFVGLKEAGSGLVHFVAGNLYTFTFIQVLLSCLSCLTSSKTTCCACL